MQPHPIARLAVLAALALALVATTLAEAQSRRRTYLPFVPQPRPTPTFTPSPTPQPTCPSTGQNFGVIPATPARHRRQQTSTRTST